MFYLNSEVPATLSDRRFLAPGDVATLRAAEDLLADAREEAARIRQQALADAEAERKRGYEQGVADAKLDMATHRLGLVDSSVAFMESVETKMAGIVLKALRKCVAEIGDEALVVQVVHKLMQAVIRTQKHVTVKVAADKVDAVRARLDTLRAAFPSVENIDVAEDPRLSGTAALLETEAGVADASIDTQLAAIERSLKNHVAGLANAP